MKAWWPNKQDPLKTDWLCQEFIFFDVVNWKGSNQYQRKGAIRNVWKNKNLLGTEPLEEGVLAEGSDQCL